tara:strand:+ start:797 stop:1063 length:267 start_codon:yes stop_codon:yes gene_type:complete
MAYRVSELNRIGDFVEKSYGNWFTYGVNKDEWLKNEYPHIIYVNDLEGHGSGYRYAKVLKTVAYIVVDEDEYGKPVVEKWELKKNFKY